MFISKLKIENYRNFRNFEIELQPFTLLIGENNVGKTNLLNAIGLIFSQDISFFKKRMLEIDDINNKIIREFKESIIDNDSKINFPEIKVEVIMEDFNDDQEAVIGDWFINQELEKAKLTYIFHPKTDLSKWLEKQKEIVRKLLKEDSEDDEQLRERKIKKIDFPLKKYGFDIYGGDNLTKRVDYYFLKMLRMEFLDALRDAKKELVASGDYRLLFKILNNRPEDKFEKIKDKLSGLQQEINENPELKNVRNEITEYLKKISLEEEENNYKVDFQISSIETTEILKKLSLIYGNEPITVDRNGLGRNNLLYISLILSHLTNTDSDNNYDVFFRFIGIEEPEAHLQPQLQDHLSMNIKNEIKDEIQILLTSHSSHIASKLKLENTIILYKDDNDIKSHYILKGIEDDKNTVRYIEKYLDATKSIMFFARKLILVEGISEQILIPKFFNLHTDKTLLELGYTIINVNGVAFKHFLKIIKNGYFIKCLVFTDKDTGKRSENRANDLKETYEKANLIEIDISNNSTFEKDIIDSNVNRIGKEILLKSLKKTKPNKSKKLIEEVKNKDIVTDDFFDMIVNDKANFAMDLLESLNDNKDKTNIFNIPDYIKKGFEFIYPTEPKSDE